jgi:hypothetical protein
VTPEVAAAVEEIRDSFPEAEVTAVGDADGGAFVKVDSIGLGAPYSQSETWVKFQITFQYPHSDVYPHFVRPDLSRIDGQSLGEGMTPVQSAGDNEPAIQISRRSNRLNPASDTAALKLIKVRAWLMSR